MKTIVLLIVAVIVAGVRSDEQTQQLEDRSLKAAREAARDAYIKKDLARLQAKYPLESAIIEAHAKGVPLSVLRARFHCNCTPSRYSTLRAVGIGHGKAILYNANQIPVQVVPTRTLLGR